jgi:hypothetical protein
MEKNPIRGGNNARNIYRSVYSRDRYINPGGHFGHKDQGNKKYLLVVNFRFWIFLFSF